MFPVNMTGSEKLHILFRVISSFYTSTLLVLSEYKQGTFYPNHYPILEELECLKCFLTTHHKGAVLTCLCLFYRYVQSLALRDHLDLDHIAVNKWIRELQQQKSNLW